MDRSELMLGDASEILKGVEDCTFDLCVTSPPYDNLRKYGDEGFEWNHTKFLEIAGELFRTMKDGGVLVWNVGDQTVNGSETGTSYRQVLSFMDIGFKLNDTMIWRKANPLPQVRQPRYSQCFEFMFVLSKGKPKAFNPIMRKCKCSGQSYDSTCKNIGGECGRTEKHFTINSETVDYNIWDMAVSQNKTGHPAVFPEELARRHILSWSNENDIVLDPFMGSGTTGISAMKLNRRFFGIEKNESYFEMSSRRISETVEKILSETPRSDSYANNSTKEKENEKTDTAPDGITGMTLMAHPKPIHIPHRTRPRDPRCTIVFRDPSTFQSECGYRNGG